MIRYEELDYEGAYLHDGRPYTGFACEWFPGGALECLFTFKDGKEHGFVREWYSSGQILCETEYSGGIRHGREREWHDNGVISRERLYEWGRLIESRSFNHDGKPTDESR